MAPKQLLHHNGVFSVNAKVHACSMAEKLTWLKLCQGVKREEVYREAV